MTVELGQLYLDRRYHTRFKISEIIRITYPRVMWVIKTRYPDGKKGPQFSSDFFNQLIISNDLELI